MRIQKSGTRDIAMEILRYTVEWDRDIEVYLLRIQKSGTRDISMEIVRYTVEWDRDIEV